ncbi:hypothetical protein QVD17_35754 [Tagetes erecta]|uniref:Secreted protein n=1 Tax=Tagetes erecta TaxID=13708 RepID=A0AAD8JTE0_TARER|nr:hypothetical protein QVD17_35754 [Tagetes erecta]
MTLQVFCSLVPFLTAMLERYQYHCYTSHQTLHPRRKHTSLDLGLITSNHISGNNRSSFSFLNWLWIHTAKVFGDVPLPGWQGPK